MHSNCIIIYYTYMEITLYYNNITCLKIDKIIIIICTRVITGGNKFQRYYKFGRRDCNIILIDYIQ